LYSHCSLHKEHVTRSLHSYIDVKVYFHAPNQFLDLNGRMGYKIRLGERIEGQVNYEDIRLISRQEN